MTLSSLNSSSRFNVLGATTNSSSTNTTAHTTAETTIVENESLKRAPAGIFKPFGDSLSTPTKSPVKFQHLPKEPSLRLKLTAAMGQSIDPVMIAVTDLIKETIKVPPLSQKELILINLSLSESTQSSNQNTHQENTYQ